MMTVRERLEKIEIVAMDVDGTFTDGTLYYDGGGEVIKGFSSHDGMGLELLRRAGITRGFITGRHDNATEARATYLGVDFFLPAVGDKAEALESVLDQFDIEPEACCFIGDDLNDLPAFDIAGARIAVANAQEPVKQRADMVTVKSGGFGAVREAVNAILDAKGIDPAGLWYAEKNRTVGAQ